MSFGRFARSPSPVAGWTTLRVDPSPSAVPSDEEDSPMPDDTPKTTRKRKNSPKASASQRKRPKAVHSATQPAPVSKLLSDSKGKGKQRHRSLDRDSTSPDFDGAESLFGIFSGSQRVSASASTYQVTKRPEKRIRGTKGSKQTSASARKPKRTKPKTAPSSISAPVPSQALHRENTPNVHGELIDISDDDDDDSPAPRRPQRAIPHRTIPAEIIVISSDDEASPGPSKAASSGPTHLAATFLRNRPAEPQRLQVNTQQEYIVVTDSEEEVINGVSVGSIEPPESPFDAHSPPTLSINGDRVSESPLGEVDLHLNGGKDAQQSPPLYVDMDADMNFDFGRPSSVLADAGSGGMQDSPILRAESSVNFNTAKNLEFMSPKVAESPHETIKSPSPIDADFVASNEHGFSSNPQSLDAALSPSPSPPVSPSPILADLPTPAVTLVSPSPTFPLLSHNSPGTSPTIQATIPVTTTSDLTKLSPSPPPASHLIRLPLQSQIRIEPSVPPLPAANAYDWGPRHHGLGGLFKNVLARASRPYKRSSSTSTPSNSVPSNDLQIPTATVAARECIVQAIGEELNSTLSVHPKDETTASAVAERLIVDSPLSVPQHLKAQHSKEEVSLPTTSSRPHDGKTLKDVINQAYKRPSPEVIDLTLDDDDDDDDDDNDGLDVTISASILETARALDEFLASDNEETVSDSDTQPMASDENLPMLSTHGEHSYELPAAQIQLHSHGEVIGSGGSAAKVRTSLDAIRSVLHKRQAVANVDRMTMSHKDTPVAPLQSTPSTMDTTTKVEVSLSLTSVVSGPTIVEALVDDVEALSMIQGNKDVEMEHVPPYDNPASSVAEPDQRIPPVPLSYVLQTNEDLSEDEIDSVQLPRYRKRPVIPDRQSPAPEVDAEDDLCDLAYPDSPADLSPSKSSPLKHEITRYSSSRPPSPPPSIRTSSRLSSRSTRSSSDDPMDLLDANDVNGVVGIYEPRSGSRTSDDLSPAGSPYITWRSVRRAARERPSHFLKAIDLPHTLQDWLNALPAMYRATDQARIIFEAAIRESTAADEPGAPPIRIYNNNDDEATPPWEFHYTNLMWHGDGVPGPDLKTLQGCDCEGHCDPKSKTCLCVLKQSKYLERTGFVYNDKGRLIEPLHYPIFECNDFCGCGEECQNRVVQLGRKCTVNIVKTKEKGWGVFADAKRIPAGTFVGVYAGELIRDSVGEERGMKYNAFGKTYLFDIDPYYLKEENHNWETSYCVDAYHAGNFTRFLNHSCEPNCMITHCYINEGDKEKPLLAVFTQEDVEPWEELCFSYSGTPDEDAGGGAVKTTQSGDGAVYVKCCCGAPSCKGDMFK